MAIKIDPLTGERITDAPQIDPVTGERIVAGPAPMVDTSNVAGAQGPLPTPAVPTVNMKPAILGYDPNPGAVTNFFKGALKSVPGTMAGITKLVPGASDAWQPLEQAAQTHGTAQAIGKGVGNAAQFVIPGAGEEKAGLLAAEKLPQFARLAAPAARMAASSLGAGTINSAQGGTFGAGATGGLFGGALGEAGRYAAPLLAETALGVRAIDRSAGRTPGQAIMQETSGISPAKIADQANQKLGLYSSALNNNAANSHIPVNLQPARDTAESFLTTATKQNNPSTIKEISSIGNQLATRPSTGTIPQFVSADEALALKRGIGDLQTSWNPANQKDLSQRAVSGTYAAMHPELANAIPNYAPLNAKVSSLMPVANRAAAADLNAGILQKSLGRLKTPTGSLIGGIAGGEEGYRHGGLFGGIAGGLAGIAAPEIMASPEAQMIAARGLYGGGTRGIATGGALQAVPRKKGLYDQ